MSKGDIVLSVQAKFAARIIAGEKSAELRRRIPRIQPGCRVWIYTKAPEARISISVIVDRVVTGTPDELWAAHRSRFGLSLDEFESYFSETAAGCAIFFTTVEDLRPGLGLSEIRSKASGFHPPQFFKWLHEGSPELKLLRSRLQCGPRSFL